MNTYTDNTQGAKKFVRDCLDYGEMESAIAARLLTDGIVVPYRMAPKVWHVRIDGQDAAMLWLDEQVFELADWII